MKSSVLVEATNQGRYYHQNEIAVCGFSGSGKTTLLEKLTRHFCSEGLAAGFLKHDAHTFDMDYESKDTFRLSAAGSRRVAIRGKEKMGLLGGGFSSFRDQELLRCYFSACHVLFIEGNKRAPIPKLLLWDKPGEMRTACDEQNFENVLGCVVPDTEMETDLRNFYQARGEVVPIFHRDSVEEIASFLHGFWKSQQPKLNGLILAGGQSVRMGEQKQLLQYQGQSEIRRFADMLESHGIPVFVSARKGQPLPEDAAQLLIIEDAFPFRGPINGILSAFAEKPDQAWLVLGCDMPLLQAADLKNLLNERDSFFQATCYYSDTSDGTLPEPLVAIYEPAVYPALMSSVATGKTCPRHLLKSCRIKSIKPLHSKALFNANTPEDRRAAQEILVKGVPP